MVFLAAWLAVYFNVFFSLCWETETLKARELSLEIPLLSPRLIMAAATALFFWERIVRYLCLLLNIYYSNV